ncbi:MAG TPA: methyltransferase domain-containing protein [Caulobacteraceae bacterium]|jgi:malonyl-CoA O-methyltransferase|nr:methyltransferase domain-containing protein [Caulobacteraceae bacterium]
MTRKQRIGHAFGRAVGSYEANASVQQLAAERLAARIATLPLPARPRVLEIGCGSGFLTGALARMTPQAELAVSDLSPQMVAACSASLPGVHAAYLVMDGERPCFADGLFDLVCSSLAVQWFDDLEGSLTRLCRLLKPGGHLAFSTLLSDSLAEWRRAHSEEGLTAGAPDFAAPTELLRLSPALVLSEERVVERHADGPAFVRILKSIGAATPRRGRAPLSAPELKRVLRRFEAAGAVTTYHLGYGVLRRPEAMDDAA